MNDLIKPFYIYRLNFPPNINSSKQYKDVIAYNKEDSKGELYLGDFCSPLISKQIRNVYKCNHTTRSNFSHTLIEPTKLRFEDLIHIIKIQNELADYSVLYLDQLLELMLINWNEWN